MEKEDIQGVVWLVLFFFILSVSILVFAAYLVGAHEQTVRTCIEAGNSWTKESCIPVIK